MNCGNCGNTLEPIHRFCPKCGAAVQDQTPPQSAQYNPPPQGSQYNPPPYTPPGVGGASALPPKQSSGSGCGKLVIIGVIILVLIGVGIGGAIYFGVRYAEKTLKSSEAFTVAIEQLKENSEVHEKLGDITDTGFPMGAFSTQADGSGNAAFMVSVQGTKGKGSYQTELRRTNGVWRVINGIVRTADGDTIVVVSRTGVITSAPSPYMSPDVNLPTDPNSKTISGGVLNGKAISLPQPQYPPIAKQVKASGIVTVQVLVDENGNVVKATPVSGHPLLQSSARAAAMRAKFSPTKLAGKPVKVSGIITYKFELEADQN